MIIVWYMILILCNPKLYASFISLTFSNGQTNREQWKAVGKAKRGFRGRLGYRKILRRWLRRINGDFCEELFALYAPHGCLLTVIVTTASYVHDPNLKMILYSALPPRWKQAGIFVLLLIEELRYLLMLVAVGLPVYQMQLLFFRQVLQHMKEIMKKMT